MGPMALALTATLLLLVGHARSAAPSGHCAAVDKP
jgi:hypothetical protein